MTSDRDATTLAGQLPAGLALAPIPAAVFAADRAMAVGVMRAPTEHGVGVPDDGSVVGVDDIPMARSLMPPATAVRSAPRSTSFPIPETAP
jgi:DNA-binding LacI/PurR family transcriptional regulator